MPAYQPHPHHTLPQRSLNKDQSPNPPISILLTLSAEIRLLIYEHLFADLPGFLVWPGTYQPMSSERRYLADRYHPNPSSIPTTSPPRDLFLTCRLIYFEAAPLFYRSQHFHIPCPRDGCLLLPTVVPRSCVFMSACLRSGKLLERSILQNALGLRARRLSSRHRKRSGIGLTWLAAWRICAWESSC